MYIIIGALDPLNKRRRFSRERFQSDQVRRPNADDKCKQKINEKNPQKIQSIALCFILLSRQ